MESGEATVQPNEASQVEALVETEELVEVTSNAPVIGIDEKQSILQKVSETINETFPHQFITLYFANGADPLLSVIQPQSDPFYVDQALLHANIKVNDESGKLEACILTPNREMVGDKMFDFDLTQVLNKLSAQDLASCTGFNWNDPRLGTLFQRLRKSDIDSSLIERFDGDIIYRSRSCKYVYSEGEDQASTAGSVKTPAFFTKQCLQCQNYLIDLDKKYMGGTVLQPINENLQPKNEVIEGAEGHPKSDLTSTLETAVPDSSLSEQPVKKRGRPKGSKNKNYFVYDHEIKSHFMAKTENEENDDPSLVTGMGTERVLVKSDDPDFIYGTEDVAMDGDDFLGQISRQLLFDKNDH